MILGINKRIKPFHFQTRHKPVQPFLSTSAKSPFHLLPVNLPKNIPSKISEKFKLVVVQRTAIEEIT